MLNIDEPSHRQPQVALLRLAFRPFFLFASLFSILAVGLWIGLLGGIIHLEPHGNVLWWHGHEMIFGFAVPVIAGFLLTAAQTWTGVPAIKGWPLAALVGLWLLPRILLLNSQWLPLALVLTLDLLFAPIVAALLGRAVMSVKQWRNLIFTPVLLVITAVNGLSYYGLVTNDILVSQSAIYAAIFAITIVIAIMGGRVIPFFTERATSWVRTSPLMWLEVTTFLALIGLIGAVLSQSSDSIRVMAAIAGISLLVRCARWGGQYTLRVPLLWSLHLSYLFVPIGMLLIALGAPFAVGLHAVTIGGMAGLILAMMARVSLGHTGRTLTPPKWVVLGFGFILCSAIARILAGLVTDYYWQWLLTSALLWLAAFLSFVMSYGPMLCRPRLDGRPG